jgi:molecular chaperone GrpE
MSQDEPETIPTPTEAAQAEPANASPSPGVEAAGKRPSEEASPSPRTVTGPGGEDPAELRDHVTGLERELAAERERAGDYMRRWQQAQADLSNLKRRATQEQEQLLTLAANQAAALVLPALDSLERAFSTLPETLHRLTWVEGISLVEFQLRRVLEAHGVAPFEPKLGDTLDPARHQAVTEVETGEHPAGSIAQVVQRGYEMNGRVLRPALVCLAREPAKSASGTEARESEPSASGP